MEHEEDLDYQADYENQQAQAAEAERYAWVAEHVGNCVRPLKECSVCRGVYPALRATLANEVKP